MLIPIETIRGDTIIAMIVCPHCNRRLREEPSPCPPFGCPYCGYYIYNVVPGEQTPNPSGGRGSPVATATVEQPPESRGWLRKTVDLCVGIIGWTFIVVCLILTPFAQAFMVYRECAQFIQILENLRMINGR
jgi:hypothetical protein